TPGFADYWGGLAGDCRLINRCDALNDLSIRGNELGCGYEHYVASAQFGARNFLELAIAAYETIGDRLRARLAERIRLSLTAAFGHGLGKIREQHREPQPKGDLKVELESGAALEKQYCGDHAANLNHKHDGVAHHFARI